MFCHDESILPGRQLSDVERQVRRGKIDGHSLDGAAALAVQSCLVCVGTNCCQLSSSVEATCSQGAAFLLPASHAYFRPECRIY